MKKLILTLTLLAAICRADSLHFISNIETNWTDCQGCLIGGGNIELGSLVTNTFAAVTLEGQTKLLLFNSTTNYGVFQRSYKIKMTKEYYDLVDTRINTRTNRLIVYTNLIDTSYR